MQLLAGKVYRAYSEFVNDQSLVVTGGSVNFFLSNNQGNPATLIANKEFFLLPEADNPYTNEAVVQWPYYDYIAFTVVSGSPLVIAPDNAFVYVGEQQTFTGSTSVMVNGLCRLSDTATSSLANRITNLENSIYEYEIFEVLDSGTTGSVTIPTGASILLNVYPNAGDCLLSKADAYDRPIDDPPVTSVGTPITCTLDAYGAWSLSGTPSSYPVCLIYQVSILGKDAHNIPLSTILDGNVVSGLHSPTAPNQFSIAAITGLQTALDGKIEGVVGGADITVDNTDPSNPVINYSGLAVVPEGGTLGQVLAKKSITDFDTEWVDPTGGGGTIEPSQWEIIETVVATPANVLATVFFDNLPTGDYRIRWNGVGVSGDGSVRWLFYDGATSRGVNYHCFVFTGTSFSSQYNSSSATVNWSYDGYTLDSSALGEVYLYNVNTTEFTMRGWGNHRDTTTQREGNQVNTLTMGTAGQKCNGIKFDPAGAAGFDAGTFILEKRIA